MENLQTNLNAFKQPVPVMVNNANNQAGQKKTFNFPNVGVVNPPSISSTPIADTIVLNKQENPKMAYKLTAENLQYKKGAKLQTICSIGIAICGLIALLSGKKKPKP